MPTRRWTHRTLTLAITVGVLAAASVVVGLRELVNSSTYQLFGDYVARVETTDRVITLTFDDGPHPRYTPMILDVLARHRVRATFFMMGRNIERHPEVARDVIARGHDVGNHSYSHPKLVFMSLTRMRDEIDRTDALIRGLGVTAAIPFRPPHAAKFLGLPYVLTTMGKISVLGDVDAEEWKGYPADILTASILRQTRPGSVIGLHDTNGLETVRALEQVIPALIDRGYRFEALPAFLDRR